MAADGEAAALASIIHQVDRSSDGKGARPSPRMSGKSMAQRAEAAGDGGAGPHQHEGKMCLVLDLDETLVHSNFKAVAGADLVVPVRLGAAVHPVHVMARPGLVNFMEVVARHFEVVVFTASVDYYANPLLDRLDPSGTLITHRLFRESCVLWQGNYIKDMSLLGRDERRSIIVDNSPASYLLHPQNALPCTSFFDDKTDNELPRLGRFLRHLATRDIPDVRQCLIEWSVFPDHGLGEDDTDVEPMGTRAS